MAAALAEMINQPDDPQVEGPLSREQEEQRVHGLAEHIGGKIARIEKFFTKPNVRNIEEVVATLNANKDPSPSEASFGHLVNPNCISLAQKNGIVTAAGPGRWRLWSPRAEWMHENVSLAGERLEISRGPITVLRVPNGHLALCWHGNTPVIITSEDGGMFAINDGLFKFVRFVRVDDPFISHGTLHILRVPEGYYALVTESGLPAVLPPGMHAFNSTVFSLAKNPRDPTGYVPMGLESWTHQTITRFCVRSGSIALAWKENQARFYTKPGVYFVDSRMFRFERCVDIDEKEITLGSRKIITVEEGWVGISHKAGELVVLPPGRHFIELESHLFDEFLCTQQECLQLIKDDVEGTLMVCETRELVRVGLSASVFFHIANPKLAVVKIGNVKNIKRFINETATAVITTIVRSTSLAEIAQSGKKLKAIQVEDVNAQTDDDQKDKFDPSMAFFDRMKEDFIDRLQENFMVDYGINVLNIRVGDFKVLDSDISKSVAEQALITADTQAKMANLEGKRQIDLVNKDCDARMEKIQADVDSHKVMMRTRAEAQAVRDQAEARADATRIDALAVRDSAAAKAEAVTIESEARAKSIGILATARANELELIGQAEANAIRVKADAEAERAKKLGDIPFGREITLAQVQATMVQESLAGVEKVVYLPTDLQKNPFALFNQNAMSDMMGGGKK